MAPLFAVALPFEVLFWATGESWPIPVVVKRQREDPRILYGRQYFSQQFNIYKLEAIRQRKPTIVVAGSSRVLQFRSEMFHPLEASFYNAGGILQGIVDLEQLADLVSSRAIPRPKVLLVGLDPWWLSRGPDHPGWLDQTRVDDSALLVGGHVAAMKRWLRTRNESADDVTAADFGLSWIGVQAASGSGFRADGSRLYGRYIAEFARTGVYRDREEPPVIERARRGLRQFAARGGLDARKVARLLDALGRIAAAGIELQALFLPMSNEVVSALNASPALKSWWTEFVVDLPQELGARGIPSVVIPSPGSLSQSDISMYDGFHPGEMLLTHYLERLIEGAPAGSALQNLDREHLKGLRDSPTATPLTFDVPESLREPE